METMHAAGRRSLPPVPAPVARSTARNQSPQAPDSRRCRRSSWPSRSGPESDVAQQFVARLRAAAADFAAAAGAESAVVREAVPPARHRRARCRVVLRYADGREVDVSFLGPAGEPGSPSRHGFDRQIRRWLGAGQARDDAWLVPIRTLRTAWRST